MPISVNEHGQIVCQICHHEIGNNARSLSNHLRTSHDKLSLKDYYDTYYKQPDEGVCKICGKPTKLKYVEKGYATTCSQKCSGAWLSMHPELVQARLAKTINTCMKKYGTTNGGGTKAALDKARQTNLSKRGVEYASQSQEVKDKKASTFLERYDATTYLHSKVGEAAVKQTCNEKFGADNFFGSEQGKKAVDDWNYKEYCARRKLQNEEHKKAWMEQQKADNNGKMYVETDEFKNKSRLTQDAEYGTWYSASPEGRKRYREIMMSTRGVEEFFQSDEFKEKAKTTMRETRGVENISQTQEWRDKVRETSLARYNAPHFSQSQAYKQKAIDKCNTIVAPFGCSVTFMDNKQAVHVTCSKCGQTTINQTQFLLWRTSHGLTPCTHCLPKNPPISTEESELAKFVESLGCHVDHYDRDFLGDMGADLVIEENKVIIEYDGIFWHSELFKPSNYHLSKKLIAEDMGYRLIHIFSDEWTYQQDIVKSRIRSLLGKPSGEKLYARKCDIADVIQSDAELFLRTNHIQGYAVSKWNKGLVYEGKLVAIMTFGQSRFEPDTTELIRFCTKNDTVVSGAAGKLFSAFIEEHPEISRIVSYADARWSTSGAFYNHIGFELVSMSKPGYFIVDGDIRRNRMQFQRHKIATEADEGKTEHDITLERGLYRIYDCGQYKFEWIRK